MTFKVLTAAIAALALAGVASAQDAGVSPRENAEAAAHMGGQYASTEQRAADHAARAEFQRSCAPDRARLCGDKQSKMVGSCLEYHRLKLSAPCKQAVTKMELAGRGAL
jgi:hypothetical protein